MSAILFGLATGLAYGSHDFFGGLASRKSPPLAVVALTTFIALLTMIVTIPIAGGSPSMPALLWGAAGGLAIAVGNIMYFHALTVGRMGVVATVTAITGAFVPLVAGVASGERPELIAWAGIVTIIASIAMITYTPRSKRGADEDQPVSLMSERGLRNLASSGLVEGAFGGLGFGLFFVALSQVSNPSESLVWPLLAATAVATTVVGVTALVRGVQWQSALTHWPSIGVAGVLYAGGNWAFILGVTNGWVSIVAVLAAMSPLPTTLFARLFLTEKLSGLQIGGIFTALLGVALITLGAPD